MFHHALQNERPPPLILGVIKDQVPPIFGCYKKSEVEFHKLVIGLSFHVI